MTRRTKRRSRGYLMIETLIGSAVLSVALGSVIGLLASARRQASANADEVVAIELARAKADELAASPHVTSSHTLAVVDAAKYPTIKMGWTVSQVTGLKSLSVPNLRTDDTMHEIVVTVDYPTAGNAHVQRTFKRYKYKR